MNLRALWPFRRSVERYNLGTFAGWAGTALVERLSLGVGSARARFEVGRVRVKGVEARRDGGLVQFVAVPRTLDAWPEALLAIVVVWVACATIVACARGFRER